MRRRAIRRRFPRRKTAWFSGAQSSCLERLDITNCAQAEAGITPQTFTLLDNPQDLQPGVVGSASDVTQARLVGDLALYTMFTANPTGGYCAVPVVYYMGVYIADSDPQGQIVPMDPMDSAYQSSGDWLWRHSEGQMMRAQDNASAAIEQRDGAVTNLHLDVTVKRKLRKMEGIYLSITPVFDTGTAMITGQNPGPGNFVCGLAAQLRMLILLP